MEIITKRPMTFGTVRVDPGTPLTVPDSLGEIMISRDLATSKPKKRRSK